MVGRTQPQAVHSRPVERMDVTSGYLSDEEALQLLCVGPLYKQIVIKSQRAADRLKFISSEILPEDVIRKNKELTACEEDAYLQKFAEVMQGL